MKNAQKKNKNTKPYTNGGTISKARSKNIWSNTAPKAEQTKIDALKNSIARKLNEDSNGDKAYAEIKELKKAEEEQLRYQCQLYKLPGLEEDKKPSKYFFQKIKQRKTSKTLTEVVNTKWEN